MTSTLLTCAPAPAHPAPGFVLVLAGGGYNHRAEHESGPVSQWLASHGIASGYLDYAVSPARFPTALDQVLTTLAELRAGTLGPVGSDGVLRPVEGPVAVLGFSAGAHLAGLAHTATADDLARVAAARPDLTPARADAAVLCYPVVSLTASPHVDSRKNLLGDRVDEPGLAAALSVENRVDATTGPAFLWHTADDATVPVAHSLGLASALGAQAVPYELHVYPTGLHGLGLAPGSGAPEEWPAACLRWLRDLGFGPQTTSSTGA